MKAAEIHNRNRNVFKVESMGPQGWRVQLTGSRGAAVHLELRSDDVALDVPPVFDGLVAAALPFVLQDGGTLHVEGTLSRGALRGFTEFAEAWNSWNPRRFQRLLVEADVVSDAYTYKGSHRAIAAWSGSLRSTHTLINHARQLIPGAYPLAGALRVIGLHPGDEGSKLEAVRSSLAAFGLPLYVVRVGTDAPWIVDPEIGLLPWIASALHAVAGGRVIGLHARSRRCTTTVRYPRPGPDLFDFLSGDAQPIRADGGSATPTRMVRDLAPYPALEAMVSNCHRTPRHQLPCGKCTDCILAVLAMIGGGKPPSIAFGRPGRFRVATLPLRNPVHIDDAVSILNDWCSDDEELKKTLSNRCRRYHYADRCREMSRWLGSMVGLHPVWPR